MKKILLLCFFTLLTCSTLTASFALDLVVVDLQKVFTESKLGKRARTAMEKEIKVKQAEVQKLESELTQSKANIQKQASLLSKAAMQEKVEQVKEQEQKLYRIKADIREEFSKKEAVEVDKILVLVKEILAELEDEHGFEAVVQKDPRLVVFSAPDVDFTSKVIDLLDENAS